MGQGIPEFYCEKLHGYCEKLHGLLREIARFIVRDWAVIEDDHEHRTQNPGEVVVPPCSRSPGYPGQLSSIIIESENDVNVGRLAGGDFFCTRKNTTACHLTE